MLPTPGGRTAAAQKKSRCPSCSVNCQWGFWKPFLEFVFRAHSVQTLWLQNNQAKWNQRQGNKAQTGSDQMGGGGGEWGKEREGCSQGAGVKDPWTPRTTGQGLAVGWGWVGQGRATGEKLGQL